MSGRSRILRTEVHGSRLGRLLGGALRLFAYAVIALASLIALLQLALPWYAADAARVARLLASVLGVAVEIERSAVEWRGRETVLLLDRLRIGGRGGMLVERAELRVDPLRLLARQTGAELRLHGLSVVVEWRDGGLRMLGLPLPGAGGHWPGRLRLTIEGGRLAARGFPVWPSADFDQLTLVLEPVPDGERWAGRARLPGEGGWLEFVFRRVGAQQRGHLRVVAADFGRIFDGLDGRGIGLHGGEGTLDFWLDLGPGRETSFAAEFALSRIGLYGRSGLSLAGVKVEPRRTIAGLSGWLRAWREGERWRVVLGDLAIDGEAGGWIVFVGNEGSGHLSAQRLPLAPLAAVAALAEGLPSGFRAWLFASAPSGLLETLEIDFDAAGSLVMRGEARDLRIAPGLGLPGLGPLRVSFQGDGEALIAELAAAGASIEWPRLYPEALPFRADQVTLAVTRDRVEVLGEGLHLGALPLDLRVEYDPAADGEGLSAALRIGQTDLATLVPQLPYGVIPPRTAGWLRRALRSGVLVGGHAVYHGHPRDWPFAGGRGGLRVSLELRDGELAFHPRWPVARLGNGQMEFRDRSLRFVVSGGQVAGLGVTAAEGEIPDLQRAEVSLRAVAVGRGEDLLGFLRASPLVHRYGPWLLGQRLNGLVDGEVDLLLRVYDPAAPDEVRGRIRLHGLTLSDAKWGFGLSDLRGELRFDQEGLRGEGLRARFGESSLTLSLAAGSGCRDPAHAFEAAVEGRLGLAEVLALSGVAGQLPLRGSGSADWLLSLSLARAAATDLHLQLSSSLEGIALTGPEPFVKAPEAVWPFALDLRRSGEGRGRGRLRLDSWLDAVWRTDPEGGAARVRFGAGPSTIEPPAVGLRIEGRIPVLAVDPWIGSDGGGRIPLDLDLVSERLLLFGGDLGAVALRARGDAEDLRIAATGERLDGELQWRSGRTPRLWLNLERLHWRAGGEGGTAPVIDPRRLPEIDAHIASLKVGEADLGEFRLEARSDPEGLRLTALEARGVAFALHGRGLWRQQREGSRTQLSLELTATELARALGAFGFAPSVADGPVLAEAEFEWPGSPLALALERVSGQLRVRSGPGRLLALEPGAGRLLGLVSLESLPKRIMLDFRDVLAPGMSFDGFSGSFLFAEGTARTDDFVLLAPGVRIEIQGATDLRSREYDQRVEVRPEVGGALPLLGALAAGAPGVAAGMLARNVLAGPLGSIGRVEYHLTGPWERPTLTRLAAAPRPPRESR